MLIRKWYWGLAALFVVGISGFVLFKPKSQLEPIKIYKVVTPASKPSSTEANTSKMDSPANLQHNDGHTHEHPHDSTSHSHAPEPITRSTQYDWREESVFDKPPRKTDPWKNLNGQQADTETANSEDSEVYPPPDWPETKDPELRAQYFHAQLINQFGDIPEVHIVATYQRKKELRIPVTINEYIASLEARYHLWQNKRTLQVLERLRKEIEQ